MNNNFFHEVEYNSVAEDCDSLTTLVAGKIDKFINDFEGVKNVWLEYCQIMMSSAFTESMAANAIDRIKNEIEERGEEGHGLQLVKPKNKREDETNFRLILSEPPEKIQYHLDYAYWHGFIKNESCRTMLEAGFEHPQRLSYVEWCCPSCSHSSFIEINRDGNVTNQKCAECMHRVRPSHAADLHDYACSCLSCLEANKPLKELVLEFFNGLEGFLLENKEHLMLRLIDAPEEGCKEYDLILSHRNNQFSLGVDARNFIDFFQELKSRNIECSAWQLFNDMRFKKDRSDVLDELLYKGVFYVKYEACDDSSKSLGELVKRIAFEIRSSICVFGNEMNRWQQRNERIEMSFDYFKDRFDRLEIVTDVQVYQLSSVFNSLIVDNFAKVYDINPYFMPDEHDDNYMEVGGSDIPRKNIFFSPHEHYYYKKLLFSYPGSIVVPNYPVHRLIDVNSLEGRVSKDELLYLKKLSVNFAICNADGVVLEVIEIQVGKHHNKAKFVERDNLKKKAFDIAGVKFNEVFGVDEKSFHE